MRQQLTEGIHTRIRRICVCAFVSLCSTICMQSSSEISFVLWIVLDEFWISAAHTFYALQFVLFSSPCFMLEFRWQNEFSCRLAVLLCLSVPLSVFVFVFVSVSFVGRWEFHSWNANSCAKSRHIKLTERHRYSYRGIYRYNDSHTHRDTLATALAYEWSMVQSKRSHKFGHKIW